jgi:hypothetical protein
MKQGSKTGCLPQKDLILTYMYYPSMSAKNFVLCSMILNRPTIESMNRKVQYDTVDAFCVSLFDSLGLPGRFSMVSTGKALS